MMLNLTRSERCCAKLFVRGGLDDDMLVAVVEVLSVLILVMWGWITKWGASECLTLLRASLIARLVGAYVILFLIGIYTMYHLGND